MKKLICLLSAFLLLLPLTITVCASEAGPSGTCGDGLSWTLSRHTLTISGSGEMADECPWEAYKDDIRALVLTGGVTYIGKKAFAECEKLRTIDFGDSLREIGEKAFYDCDRISQVRMPETFRIFGPQCFRDCESLTTVYCDGNMPSFKDSCLWNGNYVTVYHDLSHPWPEEAVSVLMNNFGGRLTVVPGTPDVLEEAAEATEDDWDGTDETEEPDDEIDDLDDLLEKYADATVPTDPIAMVTEAPTQAPTEAPTEAPTTQATEAPTTQATEAPTTQAPTTRPPETEAPTEEPRQRSAVSNGWIGLALVGGVLTFLLLGTLIFRGASHKNGRYR